MTAVSWIGRAVLEHVNGQMGSVISVFYRNEGTSWGQRWVISKGGLVSVTPQRPPMAWALVDLVFLHIRRSAGSNMSTCLGLPT
jgi:hypothetical protein